MKIRSFIAGLLALLFLTATAERALARGCLAQGTPILTPAGAVPIESLRPGDAVWSVGPSGLCRANVIARFEVTTDTLLTIHADGCVVRATPEHPFQIATGVFTEAANLRPGDTLWLWRAGSLIPVQIDSIESLSVHQSAYNLMVSPNGTYLADGIVVHNKGCFLPDTPILKSDGTQTAISQVRAGDSLKAFTLDGRVVIARVQEIITHQVDEYYQLQTDRVTLDVTAEHPFFVGNGTFKTLEALRVGDRIFAFDGDGLAPQRVTSINRVVAHVTVYNLQTDEPHTFFANGIAVHNKGGHGGGGHSSGGHSHSSYYGGHGYSSTQPTSSTGRFLDNYGSILIPGLAILAVIAHLVIQINSGRSTGSELEFVHSPATVAARAFPTEELLAHLANKDPLCDPATLKQQTESTFIKLQECWEKRDYEPMRSLLMPDLFHSHDMQLAAMVRQHEINHIADLAVERVDLVNVRYTVRPEQREFTALITARARDYFTDDRTGQFIRGDRTSSRFQEFWIFHLMDSRWLLREIEQSRESVALREKNVIDGMDDAQKSQISGAAAAPIEGTPVSTSRLDALLDKLAARDPKMWDRVAMSSRARDLFVLLLLAEESGGISVEFDGNLIDPAASEIRSLIATQQQNGETVQYRNLCVRKVELVVASDAPARFRCEYVARVSAHAQKIVNRGDITRHQDPYEVPFVRFLTFGWADEKWKLKEFHAAP